MNWKQLQGTGLRTGEVEPGAANASVERDSQSGHGRMPGEASFLTFPNPNQALDRKSKLCPESGSPVPVPLPASTAELGTQRMLKTLWLNEKRYM